MWLLVVVQGIVFLEVLRQVTAIHNRLGPERPLVASNVEVDFPIPQLRAISASTLAKVPVRDRLTKATSLLLLVAPRCPHCYSITQDINEYALRVRGDMDVIPILQASLDEGRKFISSTGLDAEIALIDPSGSAGRALGVAFTPGAVLVRDGWVRAAAVVNNLQQVETLVMEAGRTAPGAKAMSALVAQGGDP